MKQVNLTFCLTLTLTFDTDILVDVHLHLWQFSLIDMFQSFWPWANFSRSRSKIKVEIIFDVAFHKLKYEASLKSLWQLDAKL